MIRSMEDLYIIVRSRMYDALFDTTDDTSYGHNVEMSSHVTKNGIEWSVTDADGSTIKVTVSLTKGGNDD